MTQLVRFVVQDGPDATVLFVRVPDGCWRVMDGVWSFAIGPWQVRIFDEWTMPARRLRSRDDAKDEAGYWVGTPVFARLALVTSQLAALGYEVRAARPRRNSCNLFVYLNPFVGVARG